MKKPVGKVHSNRRAAAIAAVVTALLVGAGNAGAETLRVGKAVAVTFSFMPLNIGMKYGIFQKNGLEIEETVFSGGAKQQQALAAGSIDIALGGGTDMAFIAKGAPVRAIGVITHSPAVLCIIVGEDSTARGADDLTGKKIGVTNAASLTLWMVEELNRIKGWKGSDRAAPIAIGGEVTTAIALMKTHQIDAYVTAPVMGFQLEERKAGRLLLSVAEYVDDIEMFVTFAANALIERNPDAVRRFLNGWYETIAFMQSHKAEAMEVARDVLGVSAAVEEREYDFLMPKLSTDGRFETVALERLLSTFTALKIVETAPDLPKLYTEEFLPKMPAAGSAARETP
jgi:ABC-type nitrate/sulfonate/bicarbonate transport system substrate-binding protein